ncbi:MAG: ABC transporter ATP-binding protein [Oscillospiraceae bacterium]|nr:ABC transporter ATP-binding protein [Oscillospiraceae bacterium]
MIEFKNVTKKIESNIILDGVDLSIPNGAVFGLLGSNGAGKSTILRLLSGIYSNDSGEILIDGSKVFDCPETKQKVFFVNDETMQFSRFTLEELKTYYKNYYKNFSEEIFDKLRNKVKLPGGKKLSTFSKGMKRQAIVITGLACQTDFLLLDEAFDGLDPTMRIIVKNMIFDAVMDRKLTVVISSHNLKEINEICDTAGLLHNGRIIFCRDIDSVKGSIHKIQAVFRSPVSEEDFTGLDIMHFERTQSVYRIIIRGDADETEKKLNSMEPVVLDMLPLSLEEIFIYEMEVLGYNAEDIDNK